MADVVCSMDSGVGPARACHGNGTAAELREGFLQALLHGRGRRLDLPAAEGGTVVGEAEEITHMQM
jgi:hypothetical protein